MMFFNLGTIYTDIEFCNILKTLKMVSICIHALALSCDRLLKGKNIRHIKIIGFLSEVSTVHQFVYTD